MTAGSDRSAFLSTRILRASVLLLFCASLFTGCEKTDDPGTVIGTVRRDGKTTNVKLGSVVLNDNGFKYFSLRFHQDNSPYPYGAVTLYNLPIEAGNHYIEPRILDTLSYKYILDSVYCVDYYTIDVDGIWDFFRLIPDHSVNELRITEVDKTKGRIKGTFSLALERDPYMASPIPDPTHPDTIIFTEGTFDFNYKQ